MSLLSLKHKNIHIYIYKCIKCIAEPNRTERSEYLVLASCIADDDSFHECV